MFAIDQPMINSRVNYDRLGFIDDQLTPFRIHDCMDAFKPYCARTTRPQTVPANNGAGQDTITGRRKYIYRRSF